MRLTEEQYNALRKKKRPTGDVGQVRTAIHPRHKFNAKPTVNDGIRFDSKLEASYYEHLKWLQHQGEVVFFLRQTAFHLPGNTKYSADFQVFYADGSVRFFDCKGHETKAFIRAKKQVEALYPVIIEVIKRGDF